MAKICPSLTQKMIYKNAPVPVVLKSLNGKCIKRLRFSFDCGEEMKKILHLLQSFKVSLSNSESKLFTGNLLLEHLV